MKLKKIIAMALLVVSAFGCAACRGNSGDSSASDTEKTELLHGFNSVKELLTMYRVNIDNTQLCEDSNYITEGKASMKISQSKTVTAEEYAPNMVVAMVPKNKYFNKEIYSGTGYFSVDIYNPNDTAYELCVDVGNTTVDFYTVSQGWNTIKTNNMVVGKTLSHYELTFRSQAGKSAEFYIDNFVYHTQSDKYENYNFDNTATEWFDFSHEMQKTYFELAPLVKAQSVFSAPHFSITKDAQYNRSGAGALKVDFGLTNAGQVDVTSFQTREGMCLSDFSSYISEGGWSFFFDAYNDYSADIYMEVKIVSTSDKTSSKRIKIPAKSWSNPEESKVSLQDVQKDFGGVLDVKSISYSFTGIRGAGSVYLDGVGIKK